MKYRDKTTKYKDKTVDKTIDKTLKYKDKLD